MNRRYDFYADMLETHTEIGYLLVIAISLLAFNAAIAAVLWRWPGDDVYLVPGIESGGTAEVSWGATPPPAQEAAPHDPLEGMPVIDLTVPPVEPSDAPVPAPVPPDSSARPSAPAPAEPAVTSGRAP